MYYLTKSVAKVLRYTKKINKTPLFRLPIVMFYISNVLIIQHWSIHRSILTEGIKKVFKNLS